MEFLKDLFVTFIIMQTIVLTLCIIVCRHSMRIQEQLKIIYEYNKHKETIVNLVEDTRTKQHDFKNHLNTIYGIVQVTEEQNLKRELVKYINTLNNSLEDIECFLKIENKVLCAIIFNNMYRARRRDIKFQHNIESDLENFPLKDYELSEILNNLLDNAFEAAEGSEFYKREVHLYIGKENEKSFIEVKNTGRLIKSEHINKIFNRGFSTKNEKGHGYGLYNVKRIVEANNGRIQLSVEDHYVIFKLLF